MPGQDFLQLVTGLKSSRRQEDARIHDAFVQIKQRLDRAEQRLESLELFQLNVVRQLAGAGVYVKFFYLQSDLTLPAPSEGSGSLLFYLFLQDATGGWTVTLPPSFIGLFPDQIDLTPDTFSAFAMFKRHENLVVPAVFGPSGLITT